jgi:hypothetical protein
VETLQGRLLALPPLTNSLAYFAEIITAVKSFIVLGSGLFE